MKKINTFGLITFFVLLLVNLPFLVIIPSSFTAAGYLAFPPEGFSFQWYTMILDRPEFVESLWTSLKLATVTAVLATVLGTLAAFALSKYKFRGSGVINALMLSPLTVPSLIIGISALLFFTRIGIAGTFTGLLLAHILISIPYVVRLVLTGLSTFDYTLEKAGYMLGAHPLRVFWDITLPLLRPAIVSGMIFSFLTSFDNVTVSLFLVAPDTTTLPLAIFTYMQETLDPLVASISAVVILLSLVFIVLLEKVYGLERLFGLNSQSH
ncbi:MULTISPECIES: ABC transporter permease [Brevibacillus]|jgi:putative spermidine/putrescine transport system permease protein|uniref:ABC transporter permease n=1 Tax=Brevibacillus parabrevis TaxID=54914 RepID=A0A4Y3PSA9_BREPA|nr:MULTISPECIES: ABC transporter permease [Brevibacillus]MBU8715290.1 ABC transporter permease [Brevibacillus parabrevis]MDH6352043.1 putative spermidine/putrescine transport system permease protein [Brevibacillus sp. 1238]MDR4999779.1 ABC transporter permease [Brevibacillus parabrevis]MED1724928.1 ABC transporter permease [Brevibacillus parabrevis]NRQ56273.1 ABC transporter permease [Brevibacillus sp. HD1.4A]